MGIYFNKPNGPARFEDREKYLKFNLYYMWFINIYIYLLKFSIQSFIPYLDLLMLFLHLLLIITTIPSLSFFGI